jgi:hypothetical protein
VSGKDAYFSSSALRSPPKLPLNALDSAAISCDTASPRETGCNVGAVATAVAGVPDEVLGITADWFAIGTLLSLNAKGERPVPRHPNDETNTNNDTIENESAFGLNMDSLLKRMAGSAK